MNLRIAKELKDILPNFDVIAYQIIIDDVALKKSDNVTTELEKVSKALNEKYTYEDVTQIPLIKKIRDGYKALKKDPSHTRPACEALLRRILKKQELYRLGDAIDIGNIISLKLLRSVCVADLDEIKGEIVIKKGNYNDSFNGISRGIINAENLIVYQDGVGTFGSPTSDTLRTAVSEKTKNIFLMIVCFDDEPKDVIGTLAIDEFKTNFNVKDIKRIY